MTGLAFSRREMIVAGLLAGAAPAWAMQPESEDARLDAFFEAVLVNDEDGFVRANRLALLARIRGATGQMADFSKIAG